MNMDAVAVAAVGGVVVAVADCYAVQRIHPWDSNLIPEIGLALPQESLKTVIQVLAPW